MIKIVENIQNKSFGKLQKIAKELRSECGDNTVVVNKMKTKKGVNYDK